MYLHCHDCGWSQDDFWNESYNPISCLIDYKDSLFQDNHFDEGFFTENNIEPKKDENGFYITGKDFVVWALERAIRRIKNMQVDTYDEWERVKENWRCPECGSKNWDID
jgi:hypothetical protein